jgi:hypothetical protein
MFGSSVGLPDSVKREKHTLCSGTSIVEENLALKGVAMKPHWLAPRNESSRGRRGNLFLLTLSLRIAGALFIFWLLTHSW